MRNTQDETITKLWQGKRRTKQEDKRQQEGTDLNSKMKTATRRNRQGQRESQDLNTHEGNETPVDTVRAGQVIRVGGTRK